MKKSTLERWLLPILFVLWRHLYDGVNDVVESFGVVVVVVPPIHAIRRSTIRSTSCVSQTTQLHAEKERLTFAVHIHATSEPMTNVTIYELGQFLSTRTCRDFFLSAGGKTECSEESPISSELEDMWNAECQSHYDPTMALEQGDALVKSQGTVQFPGLKMVNANYCGVKIRSKNDLPYYEIILVGERRNVYGAPPIVWLFNALTGHSSEKGVLRAPSGKVQSVLSVVEQEAGPCFCFDCNAEIIVEFPKTMMKILPISKEKMEEQGTASVKKAIEKDILSALSSVNQVYFDEVNADPGQTVVNQ